MTISGAPAVGQIEAPPRPPTHDLLLDAADSLLTAADWREISMEKIALRAGVTRQTVYNAFGSRRGLEQAFVKREVDRFLHRFESVAAAGDDDGVRSLETATLALLQATKSNPMVLAITRGGADELLALFTTRGRPVVSLATERLAGFFTHQWPWLDVPDATALAETLVRLAISHGALAMHDDAITARSVAMVIGPFVEAKRFHAPASAPTPV